jgi:hypothetical protein
MIDDKATEKLKKRAQDLGLIVNASAGKKQSTNKAATAPANDSNAALTAAARARNKGGKR